MSIILSKYIINYLITIKNNTVFSYNFVKWFRINVTLIIFKKDLFLSLYSDYMSWLYKFQSKINAGLFN